VIYHKTGHFFLLSACDALKMLGVHIEKIDLFGINTAGRVKWQLKTSQHNRMYSDNTLKYAMNVLNYKTDELLSRIGIVICGSAHYAPVLPVHF